MVDKWVYAPGTKRRVKVGGPTYKSWSASEQAKAKPAPSPKEAGSPKKVKTTKMTKAAKPKTKKSSTGQVSIKELRARAAKAGVSVPKDLKGAALRKFLEKPPAKVSTVTKAKTPKSSAAKTPRSSGGKKLPSTGGQVKKLPELPAVTKTAAEKAACECPPAFKESKSKNTAYWIYYSCDQGCEDKGVWRVTASSHREAAKKILDFIAFQMNYVAGSEEFWTALGHDSDLKAEWKGSVEDSIGDAKTASKWVRRMMVPFTIKGQYDFDFFANFNPQEVVTFVVVISTPETDEFMKYLARGRAYETKSTPKALTPQKLPPPQEESKGWTSYLPKINFWS